MASTQNSRPAADEKFQAAKKEIAERNRVAQGEARKRRDVKEAEAAEKRRRLNRL